MEDMAFDDCESKWERKNLRYVSRLCYVWAPVENAGNARVLFCFILHDVAV